NFPPGRFIVSYSLGYNDDCRRAGPPLDQTCHPPLDATLEPALGRAWSAVSWKEATGARWGQFVAATSAGNSKDAKSTDIYTGMGDSRYTNMMAISAFNDPLFNFTRDQGLWSALPGYPQFDTLIAAPGDFADLQNYVVQHGLDHSVADNVIVVGSTSW